MDSSRAARADSLGSAVVVAGVSRTHGSMSEQERFHVSMEEATGLARALAREKREAVVLATCNRTELYLTGSDSSEAGVRAARALATVGGCGVDAGISVRSGEAAVRHLFSVAAGLKSVVLGDIHVAAQVREAHAAARAAGATGPLLNRLFEAAARAAKRVRSQTSIASGATSIPAVAVAIAARVAAPLADRRLLIVGAGRIARAAAINAWMRGCKDITVVNRTASRAHELASRVEGRGLGMDCLRDELATADILISATGSRRIVLTVEHLERSRALAIFDLAHPRDVDPAIRERTRLFDLDDLAATVSATWARRRSQVALAGTIASEEAERYEEWRRVRSAAPAIACVRESAERARREVLAGEAGELARLAPLDRECVEKVMSRLVRRVAHELTLELRALALADETTPSCPPSPVAFPLPGRTPGSSLANLDTDAITVMDVTSPRSDHSDHEHERGGDHAHQR